MHTITNWKIKAHLLLFLILSGIIILGCDKDNDLTPEDILTDTLGYYLFSPLGNNNVYLINDDGELSHQWQTQYAPALSVYLLDDGTLLRTESLNSKDFTAGGAGGRIAIYDDSSNEIWSYEYANSKKLLHHDVEILPNGNILMIAWEKYTLEEAILEGLNTELFTSNEIWGDHIIEVNPSTNEIVWEWHAWDHLIQDNDATKENYGNVTNFVGKINLNYFEANDSKDWNHINSVDYNENLDQILLSVHSFSEIWIINHNITTEEAATEKGDLIYRWGNPETVNSDGNRNLYFQHDAEWLSNNSILIFNNGDRNNQAYSEVLEIEYSTNEILGNTEIVWKYSSGEDFYASNISGAQRLDNGNTLICDGPSGYFFEVTADGEIIWEYTNPYTTNTPNGEMNQVFRVSKYDSNYSGLSNIIE